jgi:hypothetical protein
MPLPEYAIPFLAMGWPAALLFIGLRYGALDAVLRLLAGSVAVLTRDDKRAERCLKVLRILCNRDGDAAKPSPELAERSSGDPTPGTSS